MNVTSQMLHKMTWRFQREREQSDSQWAVYDREFQTLYQRFRAQHPRNRALIRQLRPAGRLGKPVGVRGEAVVSLGLQMGLELGNPDQLREL